MTAPLLTSSQKKRPLKRPLSFYVFIGGSRFRGRRFTASGYQNNASHTKGVTRHHEPHKKIILRQVHPRKVPSLPEVLANQSPHHQEPRCLRPPPKELHTQSDGFGRG